ncbi:MAG: hypothetical protein QOG62_1324 [Thermoleophilaceae bacterium]|nr:hypothetical protein [Thermoleophilaceae bacterium]
MSHAKQPSLRSLLLASAAALGGFALGASSLAPANLVIALALTGLALAVMSVMVGGHVGLPPDDLERQLAWFRRRDEQTDLLVVRVAAHCDLARIRAALRTTDHVAVGGTRSNPELRVVLDKRPSQRVVVEQRLEAVARAPITCGWAGFPEQGWTIDALLEAATHHLGHVPAVHALPLPARSYETPLPRTTVLTNYMGGPR